MLLHSVSPAVAAIPTQWTFGDGDRHALRLTGALQLWLRQTDLNPGSAVSGQATASETDLSIRRFRAGAWLSFEESIVFRLNLGFNNFNRLSDGDLQILDAYAEYRQSRAFQIGFGKSGWNGLSRYAAPNPMNLLAYDLPVVALPTLNVTDDLLRTLGVFIKGQMGSLDYRFTVYKPYSVEDSASFDPELEEGIAKFRDEDDGNTAGASGYLKWQFFEHESNASAFSPGTYFGEKKVMSVGIGFEFDSNRTAHLDNGEEVINDLKLWAIDYFVDLPIGDAGNAFTAYAAFYDYDYGPNLVRNIGVNNISTVADPDDLSFNGPGNRFPVLGTGQTLLLRSGYFFRAWHLQPYFSLQFSDFERLDDVMLSWNVGAHYLFNGHKSRLSLNLESRPVYLDEGTTVQIDQRKHMFVVQYQFQL